MLSYSGQQTGPPVLPLPNSLENGMYLFNQSLRKNCINSINSIKFKYYTSMKLTHFFLSYFFFQSDILLVILLGQSYYPLPSLPGMNNLGRYSINGPPMMGQVCLHIFY